MTGIIRRLFFWLCALLAVGVAVLAVRSFWRADEIGYYTYKPVPGQPGLDRRQLIGSWRGGVFWLSTQEDVDASRVDWCGGQPTEIIVRHTTDAQLATAALQPANASVSQPILPVPRWGMIGFNLKSSSGGTASKPWYRLVVVPYWALCLVLAWWPFVAMRRHWIARYRRNHGLCLHCGYDLRATGEICSECGQSRKTPVPIKGSSRRLLAKRSVAVASCGMLAMGIASALLIHRHGEHFESALRLDRATVLSADHLPQRVELVLAKGVTMRFALIPAGHFLMGSPPDEPGRDADETQHEVVIGKPFYMGITTVTQEQYEAVTGGNPSYYKGPKNPVETVSWDEAKEFCQKLSEKTGKRFHLPTEAQWEYACRAGTTSAFNTGRTLPRDRADYAVGLTYPGNRVGSPASQVLPAGSFPPNAWGLYDMHGNVWQWCSDWYGEYPKTDVTDPTEKASGSLRVLRGGSWIYLPQFCRAACRIWRPPVLRIYSLGFRLVLDF